MMKKLLLCFVGLVCSLAMYAAGGVVTPTSTLDLSTMKFGNTSVLVNDMSQGIWSAGTGVTTNAYANSSDYFVVNAYKAYQNAGNLTWVKCDGSGSGKTSAWTVSAPFKGGAYYGLNADANNTARANSSRSYCFRVTNCTEVKAYVEKEVTITAYLVTDGVPASTSTLTASSGTSTTAISTGTLSASSEYVVCIVGTTSSNRAFMEIAFKKPSLSTETPSFTTNLSTTAYEAVATKEFSLSVAAKDFTSLQWYRCDDAAGSNPQSITGATDATYKFTPSEVGTNYFYCVATNSNASGEKNATSNVATVNIAENSSYVVKWQNVGGWGLRAPSGMTSGSEFEKNTTIALSADNGASYHFVGWTVNGDQVSTDNAYTHTVTGAAEIKGVYEANKKLIFAGTSQEAYADKDGNITVPQNWYNYQEGKTVVSWTGNDGETYVPGEKKVLTEDVTLTPNYTSNKKQLAYGATVTWSFAFPNSAPLFNSIQGAGAVRNYVQQADVNGTKIDVNMFCDATAGKMDNCRRMSNDLTQVNNGTKFTIPAVNGMTVKVNANGNMSATTIAGSTSYTGTGTKNISYTYEGTEETIEIVIKDGSYLSSIVVVYPKTVDDPTQPTTIFSAKATAKGTISGSAQNVSVTDYATVSGGSMYVSNGQTDPKDLVTASAFSITNGNTTFKIVLDEALQAGDVINVDVTEHKDTKGLGLVFTEDAKTTGTTGTDTNQKITENLVYTVTENDGICGETTFYINRAAGKTTYFQNFTISRPATIATVNVSSTVGYATFYSDFETRMPANTKAYTATYNSDRSTVTLNEIDGKIIPAETAVVIEGEGGDFLYSNTGATFSGTNDLKGTATDIAASSVTGGIVCVLGYMDGETGFFKFTEGKTLAANKAYLVIPTTEAKAKIRIVKGDEEATGISTVNAKSKSGVIYNLAGQRVNANAKGLVIINGKVVKK